MISRERPRSPDGLRGRKRYAGLAVGWFDEATQRYYIEQSGKRFLAEVVDGALRPVAEVAVVDAA